MDVGKFENNKFGAMDLDWQGDVDFMTFYDNKKPLMFKGFLLIGFF